jgi:hypothetical protein
LIINELSLSNSIIDAANAVRQKPSPYDTVYHALSEKTTAKVVKCFIAERPPINLAPFAREWNIDWVNFSKIIAGLRSILQPNRGQVLSTMKKYGFYEYRLAHGD